MGSKDPHETHCVFSMSWEAPADMSPGLGLSFSEMVHGTWVIVLLWVDQCEDFTPQARPYLLL